METEAVRDHCEDRHGVGLTKGDSDVQEEHRDPPTRMPLRRNLPVRYWLHLRAVIEEIRHPSGDGEQPPHPRGIQDFGPRLSIPTDRRADG